MSSMSENESNLLPYKSSDEAIESAISLYQSRCELGSMKRLVSDEEKLEFEKLSEQIAAQSRAWHARLDASLDNVVLAQVVTSNELDPLEREILVAALMDPLGLVDCHSTDVTDILRILALPPSLRLSAMRALSEVGRLHTSQLIFFDDLDADLRQRKVYVDPGLVQRILYEGKSPRNEILFKDESSLCDGLARVIRVMRSKSSDLELVMKGYTDEAAFQRSSRKLDCLMVELESHLRTRRDWKLSTIRARISTRTDWTIFLALVGKAVGHLDSDDELFTGAGLARVASKHSRLFPMCLMSLLSTSPLSRDGLIQPCGGFAGLLGESEDSLQRTEFELTPRVIEELGIKSDRTHQKGAGSNIRDPRIAMSAIVLDDARGTGMNA